MPVAYDTNRPAYMHGNIFANHQYVMDNALLENMPDID